ncbi:MAG: hypothetical protein JW866_04855, partial [Ignavibacteriales bacterium]|nr:hypothetical protein [Ignavibacteriales bacterium]
GISATVLPQVLKDTLGKIDSNITLNQQTDYELLVPTFLGNDQRRFYGRGIPKKLKLINKFKLGCGQTYRKGMETWCGAGWTGQPAVIKDKGKIYLVCPSYDHNLRKIEIDSFKEVWRYKFDDILKGSPTVYVDPTADEDNRLVILQGSRGTLHKEPLPHLRTSLRAVSFRTGKELWRIHHRKTDSYSQDNDSSPIDLKNGELFNGSENAIGYFLSSKVSDAQELDKIIQPKILAEVKLYDDADISKHSRNLVTESSPARFGDIVYVASGAGHIYGINIKTREIIFDYYTGSDIDGSAVISIDGKLFAAIEKEYIPGKGGVLKLDLHKMDVDSVEWYLPTGDKNFSSWKGGIIGSVALNDEYNNGELPYLFATNTIEGKLYIGSQDQITGEKVDDPLKKNKCDKPVIAANQNIGTSITTPIFTDGNKLVSATYDGVNLFEIHYENAKSTEKNVVQNKKGEYFKVRLEKIDKFMPGVSFEATPVVWDGIVYVNCRDGYLYALG